MNGKMIEINSRDLPLTVRLKGDCGQEEFYLIAPAGRKFGASLQKVIDPLRRMLRQKSYSPFKAKER